MTINTKVANKYAKLIAKLNPNLNDFDKRIILRALQEIYDLGFSDGLTDNIIAKYS